MNDRDPLEAWSRFAFALGLLCGCVVVLCALVALGVR